MAGIVDSKPISDLIGKYFERLKNTGNVDKNSVNRYMLYLMLVEFIDSVHVFFSEKDYKCIDALLSEVFSGCNCLLTYDKNVTVTSHYLGYDVNVDSFTIGKPWYMGNVSYRIAEQGEDIFRISEDDILRATE